MKKRSINLPFQQSLGPRVRQFRQRLALTQTALAQRANMNQGYLSEIERGRKTPAGATLRALAIALDVPEGVLLGKGALHDAPQPLETRELPLFGAIPAGPPSVSQEQLEMFPILRHLWAPDRYCLRLHHDSMEPTLKPGDIVLVDYRPDVNPEHVQGRICACLVDGQATLKRIWVERRIDKQLIVLRGDNPDSPTVVIDESSEFSIQGVVVSLVSREL